MSSASSVVTYTSVYTDSKPGRAFWGADDEEISEGGPEDPQTPPVPQDEDEREPMMSMIFHVAEQPLPPVDSSTAESPRYVTKSDPEEDLKEYEDDENEGGRLFYPLDGGVMEIDDDG
ncbi:hypothetical protein Tco_0933186 [Tanacetum coccineum]